MTIERIAIGWADNVPNGSLGPKPSEGAPPREQHSHEGDLTIAQ